MPRPEKWRFGKFKILKLRIYDEKLERYQQILKVQKKTMQKDFEDHVNRVISGINN